MKIYYVAREKPDLGRAPTIQIFHTLYGLAAHDVEIVYVTPWSERLVRRHMQRLTGREVPSNLQVVSLGGGPDFPLLSWLAPGFTWEGFAARLKRFLKRVYVNQNDAIVYTRNRRAAAALGELGLPPVIFEYHEPRSTVVAEETDAAPDAPHIKRLLSEEQQALRHAAALVTVTYSFGEQARASHRFSRIHRVIPNGADPNLFAVPAEDRQPIPGRLLYIGSLIPWKGVGLALEAISRLPEAELHICGGQPKTKPWEELVHRARELNVLDRITLHGTLPQRDLRPLMRTAVAGVLPLNGRFSIAAEHTSPLKIFEYLCAGLPVITADLPSVKEILTNGRDSLLFTDNSAESFAAVLDRILSDPRLASRLSEGARQTGANYTWQARGGRIKEVCSAVLAGRGRDLRIAG